MQKKIILLLIVLFAALILFAGTTDAASLKKHHSIDLNIGYLGSAGSEAVIGIPGVNIGVTSDNLAAKIAYSCYFDDRIAFQASIGIMQPKVRIDLLSVKAVSVTPVLFGLKYYPLRISDQSRLKPFFRAAGGVMVGSESGKTIFSVRSHTEGAVLFNLGAGADLVIGSLFKLNFGAGYNLAADFSESIGGRTNYSGTELYFGFGFMF